MGRARKGEELRVEGIPGSPPESHMAGERGVIITDLNKPGRI